MNGRRSQDVGAVPKVNIPLSHANSHKSVYGFVYVKQLQTALNSNVRNHVVGLLVVDPCHGQIGCARLTVRHNGQFNDE